MDELEKLLKDIQQLNGIKDYEKVIEILPVSILEKHQNDELYAEIAQAYLMLKNFDLLSPSALPISLRAYPLKRHLAPMSTVLRFMQ